MRLPRVYRCFLALTLLAVAATAVADDSLKTAYSAILKGDYEAGRASIGRMLETGEAPEQVKRVDHWLGSYESVVSSREELRQKTFDWNVEQGQKQLDGGNVYLALSFAAQAAAYASDKQEFADSAWVQEVRAQALPAAAEHAQHERWTKALAFYRALSMIFEDDKEIEALQEQAIRHARLVFVYKTEEDLQRRIKDVSEGLLYKTLALIDDNYYETPDFKKMGEGALDNLVALATTTKLYTRPDSAGEFDGIADPVAREYFLARLEEERAKLEKTRTCTRGDLRGLFSAVKEANNASISLPTELLVVEFMEGALGELDEFTSIIWPVDSAEFDKMMIGNFVGVGIQLGIDEVSQRLKVVTPLENSPALESGIQPDDLIIAVDGVSTKDWTTDKAVREITGPEGTEVTLTMYRPSQGKYIDFPLKRRPIKLTTIRGVERLDSEHWDFMLDQDAGVAYIRLTNFNPDSEAELRKALFDARAQGMRGLILDLRHNPGGLLDVAIETVSTFLSSGEVVATDGKHEKRQRHMVSGDAEFAQLPLVVLVNEHSASASEILAGALRDHQRGLVLGERTFGKGSVQRVFNLPQMFGFGRASKARLKLTTALYYLPDGESPHKRPDATEWGVEPDWKIELTPKEFGKVLDRQRQAFIIHNEDEAGEQADETAREKELAALKANEPGDDEDEDLLSDDDIQLLRSDPYEAPDADPQLETALLHLRVKLAANVPWPRQLARTTTDEDSRQP